MSLADTIRSSNLVQHLFNVPHRDTYPSLINIINGFILKREKKAAGSSGQP